jgi:hypothetical protein
MVGELKETAGLTITVEALQEIANKCCIEKQSSVSGPTNNDDGEHIMGSAGGTTSIGVPISIARITRDEFRNGTGTSFAFGSTREKDPIRYSHCYTFPKY